MQTAEGQIPVSEIFFSIRRRSLYSEPSIFLRTYRCNLSCTWCDTKYSWLGQEKSQAGVEYRPRLDGSSPGEHRNVRLQAPRLTGGEPLLHQRTLSPLLAELKKGVYFIEVETNGTIAPIPETVESVDCFNVSPKISNSRVEVGTRIRRRLCGRSSSPERPGSSSSYARKTISPRSRI